MEEVNVTLERHTQHIKSLQHQIDELKEVQNEIRRMNEVLVTLANELKHTNEHLQKHEATLAILESVPKHRLNTIVTAIISAVSGGIITTLIALVLK